MDIGAAFNCPLERHAVDRMQSEPRRNAEDPFEFTEHRPMAIVQNSPLSVMRQLWASTAVDNLPCSGSIRARLTLKRQALGSITRHSSKSYSRITIMMAVSSNDSMITVGCMYSGIQVSGTVPLPSIW